MAYGQRNSGSSAVNKLYSWPFLFSFSFFLPSDLSSVKVSCALLLLYCPPWCHLQMVETRLTALENSVSTLQRSLNAQDSKLDTLIDLQVLLLQ